VRAVDLPSTAERGGLRQDLYDDAAVVRRTIQEIEGPVVVVAHSYAGAVVSEAAANA
jgi:predicted alpha/beta hydrolase family esterase